MTDRLLTFPQLKSEKGWPFSRVHTDRLENAGQFPRRVRPGCGQMVAWWESEIEEHLANLPRGIDPIHGSAARAGRHPK